MILTFALLIFTILILWLIISVRAPQYIPPIARDRFPRISVVVPFKNEEDNLATLIASVRELTYHGAVEMILVDDGSTDCSRMRIEPFLNDAKFPITVISHSYDPLQKLTGKQQALDAGIAASTYDIIALTDADARPSPEWLKKLVETQIAQNADLVFGRTAIADSHSGSPFEMYQRYQLDMLFGAALLLQDGGFGSSCMGNNILLRKQAYLDIGGQQGIGYSITEDRDLLMRFKRAGKRVVRENRFHAILATSAHKNLPDFWRQMMRWALGGMRKFSFLSIVGVLVALETIAFWGTLAGLVGGIASIVALVNMALFILALNRAFIASRSSTSALLAPFFSTLCTLALPVIGIMILTGYKPIWKGNRV